MKLRKFMQLALAAMFSVSLAAGAQTIMFSNGVQKYASLTSTTVNMSGKCELWVTNFSTPLSGCTINLNSVDAWLFLPGIKPSVVASTYLGQVLVSGAAAVADSNVRVVQYGQSGAVIIPQSSTFQPLTVYSEAEFVGTATQYSQYNHYTGGTVGGFRSFKLKRGYQVVFAQDIYGANYSKCYVAQDGDLEIGVLPGTLDRQVQFIYVTPWRWVSKKGIAGDPGISLLNVNSWYDWNIDSSSTRDLEYVPIRSVRYWPSLGQNWQSLGANTVLGYNEPDNTSQANIAVGDAIYSWPDLLGTGLRVGSPGCSDGGVYNWLLPFIQQANTNGLRVDFVAQHYYQAADPSNPTACANQMYNFLLNIWNNTHLPIWVTEWNNGANWTDNSPYAPPTYAQQQADIAAMTTMLENAPFVERYQLYNWVEDVRSLVTSGNTVTAAGTTYSNLVSNLAYSQAMPDNGTRGIAQYLFATNTVDTSGYCNNAMAASAPAFTNGHNSQTSAIILDGANNYVQLPANIAKANAFTFAAWVYWNGGASWQRIFDFGDPATSQSGPSQYMFLTPSSSSGKLRFAIENGGSEQDLDTSALTSGTWQHVAITLSGSTAILYVNGAQAATSSSFSILPSAFSPTKNYLGKSQFTADPLFGGKLDEVEIADYAMTAAQISTLYTTVQTPASYTDGIWTNNADGNWGISNNWSGGVIANGGAGSSYTADFSTLNISADRTVTLDSARGIGALRFGDISGSQNWILTGLNTLMLGTDTTNAPSIVVNQNTATISTPLGGTNGFAKSGAGTLILAGASSPSGTVYADSGSASASDGILRVTSPGALATATGIQIRDNTAGSSSVQLDGSAGNISLASIGLSGRNNSVPAIENLAGTNTLLGGLVLNGSGKYLVQSDAGALNLGGSISGSSAGATTLTLQGSGNVNVPGSITDGTGGATTVVKNGSGSLFLNGASTYTGGTIVNQGTLTLQPAAPAPPLLHLTFNNAAGSGNGSIITNTGSGGSAFNGTIVSSGGANIVTGGRYGNALSLNGAGGTTATNIVLINSKVMNTDASGTWTVGYWIKTGTAGAVIMYQGDGTWSSAGQTTFYLNNGNSSGTHAGAVRNAGGWLTGTTALNNSAWHFVTLVDTAGTESIFVDGNVDAVTSTMANLLATNANQIWIGGSPDGGDGGVKMTGLIDEVYMFNRALSQTEVQALYNGNNLYTNSGNVLPVTTPVTVASGATLDLGGVSQTVASLAGNGLVTNSGPAATLTVSNSTGTTTFSGNLGDTSLANALSFVQNGNATSILSGANTYRGPTIVNGGTLLVSGSIGSGAVTVTSGTLGGSGVIGGAVTVQSGGALLPGGSFNTLAVNNNLALQTGSTTMMEISKTPMANDQLRVTGALTFGGTLVVTNLSGALAAGDVFTLFQAGTFNGSFASNLLPPLNTGLAWSTANLSSGVINVVQTTPTNLTWSVTGTNMNLSWPVGYIGWRLQTQTNALNAGLGTNWFDVTGSTPTNNLQFPMDINNGSVFYRLIFQ